MNITEFRRSQGLVNWLLSVKTSPNWAMMLEAMEGSHPRRTKTDDDPAKKLGIIEGFDAAVDMLSELSAPVRTDTLIESTFGVDDGKQEANDAPLTIK